MKKILMAALAALALSAASFAQEADLTDASRQIKLPEEFNLGRWYDQKWDAYWEIKSDNIILYKGTEEVISFSGKIKNWKVTAGKGGLVISFDCDETARSYKITKPITLSTDLDLEVERHDVDEGSEYKEWKATIKRQK